MGPPGTARRKTSDRAAKEAAAQGCIKKHRLRSAEKSAATGRSKSEDTQADIEFNAVVSSHETLDDLTTIEEPRLVHAISTSPMSEVDETGATTGGAGGDEYEFHQRDTDDNALFNHDDDDRVLFGHGQGHGQQPDPDVIRREEFDTLQRELRRVTDLAEKQMRQLKIQEDSSELLRTQTAAAYRRMKEQEEARKADDAAAKRKLEEDGARAIARAEQAEATSKQTLELFQKAILSARSTNTQTTHSDGEQDDSLHHQTGGRHKLLLKTPDFDGTGDVDAFLNRFDSVRVTQRWSDQDAVLMLSLSLKGKAEPVGSVKPGTTYTQMVAQLRSRYGSLCTFSSVTHELRQMRWKKQQSLQDFAAEVQDTANKVKMPPTQYAVLTRDTFVTGLNQPHMAHYINSKDEAKEDLMVAVDWAKKYIQEHGPVTPSAPAAPSRLDDAVIAHASALPVSPSEPENTGTVNAFKQYDRGGYQGNQKSNKDDFLRSWYEEWRADLKQRNEHYANQRERGGRRRGRRGRGNYNDNNNQQQQPQQQSNQQQQAQQPAQQQRQSSGKPE